MRVDGDVCLGVMDGIVKDQVLCCCERGRTSTAGVQYRGHSGFPLRKRSCWVTTLKNTFNIEAVNYSIPDIKLIRTDTTLDLSQKAEKGMSMHQPNADSCSNRSTIDSNIRLPVAGFLLSLAFFRNALAGARLCLCF